MAISRRKHPRSAAILGGVIDSGFTGEIAIMLITLSPRPYSIDKGQALAQLVIYPCRTDAPTPVSVLPSTDRVPINGTGGLTQRRL